MMMIKTRRSRLGIRSLVAFAAALLALPVAGSAVAAPQEEKKSSVQIQSNAFAEDEKFPAIEASFTPQIEELRAHKLVGEVVHVGFGCPNWDPYLADPNGKIALIERGVQRCRFDWRVARAQLAGATGVVFYNHDNEAFGGGDNPVGMGGENPATLPDGTTVEINIPAVMVGRSVGLLLRDGPPPVDAQLKAKR